MKRAQCDYITAKALYALQYKDNIQDNPWVAFLSFFLKKL